MRDSSTVSLHWDDVRVATHERRGSGPSTQDSHLPDHRGDLRHRGRGFWEERAARIGPDTASYVKALFDSDDVLSMLRAVQAVVRHLERFPKERAEAACRRASFFGTYGYAGIKQNPAAGPGFGATPGGRGSLGLSAGELPIRTKRRLPADQTGDRP